MEKKNVMTRREFLKRNLILVSALAFIGAPLKVFAGAFRRRPNVSDKEARYYKRLAG